MKNNPLFSIVMPVYNSEKYLKEAVDSVLLQTFSDFELILVDDYALDNSPKICDELSAQDNRIIVVHLKENGGASNARNVGIDIATGKYVYFMDSDDIIEKDLFEVVFKEITLNSPQVVMFGFTEDYYDKSEQLYYSSRVVYQCKVLDNPEILHKDIINIEKSTLFGYPCNKFYLLEKIKDNNIKFIPLSLNEDFKFNIDLFRFIDTLSSIDYAGYHYNKRENQSLTGRFVAEYFDLQIMRVGELLRQYKEWNLCDEYVLSILGNIYVRDIFSALQRNCDKKSKMTYKSRKKWITDLYNQDLFNTVVPYASPDSKIVILMSWLLKKRKTFCLLTVGRLIYLIKLILPTLFARAKQKK